MIKDKSATWHSRLASLSFWAAVVGIITLVSLGGTACAAANQSAAGVPTGKLPAEISVEEAYQKYQAGVFVLDVRTPAEWDDFHVPNTTNIPLDELANRLAEVPRDREVVVICRSGNRSQAGRDILAQAGFDKVTSVSGGLTQWRSAGYPVE